ncbi:T9SS type A sorting domain-containing protein [uncultured Fluviicola sp.]|uniref:T9SS type A sorting domain-containing protein n=1 Tax=uncultured Fluviicola sp. TaxID=463303 RepID=UPI0025DCC510|nr:T9SS type A sorting domain-containing protein [uncultured Fluviicola sp.]
MNKLLLCGALFAGLSAHAQTTLFQDNFESGAGNWTLNSADMSGVYTANHWVVNNSYTGGTGSFVCFGFPFSFTVGVTPAQPAGITTPNGNYMHISSLAGETSGITNANFLAADGLCTLDESNFTKMTNSVSTVGYSNVTLSFWDLVGGEAGTVVGEVYYSLDNGSSWVLKTGGLNNITTWTSNTLTDAAWDNVASLKIAFRFLNTVASAPIDPSFSIDDVKITGSTGASASLATGTITSTTYCSNQTTNVSVPFTVTGTVNAGNVYTAQLSDNTGSFAAPTAIGTLSSTGTGSLTISAVIPSGLTAGTGYRIRVDASNPATTGTDNGMNLTVAASPSITATPSMGTICAGNSTTITASGANSYTWSPAGTLSSSTGASVTATPLSTQVYTLIGTDGNGCSTSTPVTINVAALPSVTTAPSTGIICIGNSTTITASGANSYTWSPAGTLSSSTGASVTATPTSTQVYIVTGTDGNGCSNSTTVTITVESCAGLEEETFGDFELYPNPANQQLIVNFGELKNIETIVVLDLCGRKVLATKAVSNTIDVSSLQSGKYFLVIEHEAGVSVKSFMKR